MGIFDKLFGPPNVEKLEEKRDVEGLIKALQYKEDKNVRWKAAEALRKRGDDRAVEPLILALKDDDGHVREETVAALREVVILGKIGDERRVKERVVEAFIQALKDDDGPCRQVGLANPQIV